MLVLMAFLCHPVYSRSFSSTTPRPSSQDGHPVRHVGGLWYLPRLGGQGEHVVEYMGWSDILLACVIVALRVPYRSPGAVIAAERAHLSDPSEAEWQQGRPLLQCWQLEWTHAGHLHEEERSKYS